MSLFRENESTNKTITAKRRLKPAGSKTRGRKESSPLAESTPSLGLAPFAKSHSGCRMETLSGTKPSAERGRRRGGEWRDDGLIGGEDARRHVCVLDEVIDLIERHRDQD